MAFVTAPVLGLIVFLASIVVPFLKLLALFYLVATVKLRSAAWRRQRLWIFRMLEFIGPWAMLDVFVPRYARLVRIGSRFWSASGVDVNVSLFKGVEISVESLRSLVAGGVAFATPDASSPPAKEGTIFVLHDKPQKEWLAWAPKIPLPAGN